MAVFHDPWANGEARPLNIPPSRQERIRQARARDAEEWAEQVRQDLLRQMQAHSQYMYGQPYIVTNINGVQP